MFNVWDCIIILGTGCYITAILTSIINGIVECKRPRTMYEQLTGKKLGGKADAKEGTGESRKRNS